MKYLPALLFVNCKYVLQYGIILKLNYYYGDSFIIAYGRSNMFSWFTKKNRKLVSTIIILILVLAMVVPMCVSVFSGM